MALRLQFWGAAQTVTGSLHHIQSPDGNHFFLDCGLFQGRRQEAGERNRSFPVSPASVHAILLSHAHLDHAGNLPTLVKYGFRGPIYCTPATADLLPILLTDSAHLMQRDIEYINKRKISRGQDPLEPLYTVDDVEDTIQLIVPVPYHEQRHADSSLRFRFLDAGHILGSAITELHWIASNGEERRLVFSGDLGRDHLPILRDPEKPSHAEYIIMESTYGGRLHDPLAEVENQLADLIRTTIRKRAKILIPAFSVGRTQEILYVLNELLIQRKIPPIRVYLDSPMAIEATAVFSRHPDCFDSETLDRIRQNQNPLFPPGVSFLKSVDDSKSLNALDGPAIIISASGMCEGGRIVHHIANHASNPDNCILFVGYQGEHTLGRKILDGHAEVKLLGDEVAIRCHIHKLLAFSAHADEREMLEWLSGFNQQAIRTVFLVHGEPGAQDVLKSAIEETGLESVTIARHGDVIKLG